jgi:hypothetical protein
MLQLLHVLLLLLLHLPVNDTAAPAVPLQVPADLLAEAAAWPSACGGWWWSPAGRVPHSPASPQHQH